MTNVDLTLKNLEITDCDREPIHLLGSIQPFAALMEFSFDGSLLRYSENAFEILGIAPAAADRCKAIDLFSETAWDFALQTASAISHTDQVERLFHVDGFLNGRPANLNVSRSQHGFIVEIEPSDVALEKDIIPQIRQVTANLDPSAGLDQVLSEGADQVRELTGYDRVMIYRFRKDGSGEVVAESLSEKAESFLGLRYPASDIPRQARALYMRKLIRVIADVEDETVPIVSTDALDTENAAMAPLDLSLCSSRAVSPRHIQYLKNMGVRSSMSISITEMDELWGLIACHNVEDSLLLPTPMRSAMELFGQIFSYRISECRAFAQRDLTKRAQLAHSRISRLIADPRNFREKFNEVCELIQNVTQCDGIFGWVGGEYLQHGEVPDEAAALPLLKFLDSLPQEGVFATDNLSDYLDPSDAHHSLPAGILMIPISGRQQDYLILCRSEMAKGILWGGDPRKVLTRADGQSRPQPRGSFAAWKEDAGGRSEEWSRRELELAETLRSTFVEVLFKLTEENAREKERANQKQALLISELNHRVRNILTLITSLVDQTSEQQTDIDAYKTALTGRLSSLTRAHDQMTSDAAPGSFRTILETEFEPYVQGATSNPSRNDRLRISGPELVLDNDAVPLITLVIHELVTNAVKYGALKNNSGTVDVDIRKTSDNGIEIAWKENGGPEISTMSAPGTGTILITEAVPFQLSGKVEIDPRSDGMYVKMSLPNHIFKSIEKTSKGSVNSMKSRNEKIAEGRHILILEDEFVIARTVKKLFESLGAQQVTMVSNTAQAIEALDRGGIDFAVLDINLGRETSEVAAMEARERDIPFAFASGYGRTDGLTESFDDVPRLTKPFTKDALTSILPERVFGKEPLETT
ncbi:MAG: GAF domain-containing protein [Pseudomonadota bacterium]|nr:GAF domain-containing protein [Pseudomonadota bacterium]